VDSSSGFRRLPQSDTGAAAGGGGAC
jgi:hypothetical protein